MTMLCKKIEKDELSLFLSLSKAKWVAEVKEDGDRVRLQVKDGKVSLFNRRGDDVTFRYPELHDFTSEMDIFVDGEMCVKNGEISLFNEGIAFRTHCKSESAVRDAASKYPATYVVFDILQAGERDMRGEPYSVRRELLLDVFNVVNHPNIEVVEQSTDAEKLFDEVVSKGGEGIILKDVNGLYHEGKRSALWRKVKDVREAVLTFTKYEEHPRGITIENEDGIRVNVNGYQSRAVKDVLDTLHKVAVEIRYLGEKTKAGKYRQPVFFRLAEVG